MSIITKETFVSATFIDQDRKNLEVLLNMGHTDELHLTPHIVEADEDNADYKKLLKITTLDAIHEETHKTRKMESLAFMETAKLIMRNEGLADQQEMLSKTKIFPAVVDNIFTNMENEDHLFALKLALFELQEIRESDNIAAKTALRKAQHKFEVLKHAFEITGVRETTEDVVSSGDRVVQAKALDEQYAEIIEEQAMPPHKRPKTIAKKTAETTKKKATAAKKIATAKGTEKKGKK